MKKIYTSIVLLLTSIVLVACGTSNSNSTSSTSSSVSTTKQESTATLIIELPDSTYQETVKFEEGDTVSDILKKYVTVEEEDGMVTSLNGVSQDTSTSTYWMYDINGSMAEKGVEEQTVSQDDTIRFYLQSF